MKLNQLAQQKLDENLDYNNILPDCRLQSRQNQYLLTSGIDSPDNCLDFAHYQNYPHKVEYHYNSRGFRDAEWPQTLEELKNSIWCFGDSFTVGLGCPLEHTWPYLLSQQLNKRCINISMDGASNEWISRWASKICTEIQPELVIIQWSYVHRRESLDVDLSDEERRIYHIDSTLEEDLDNIKQCVLRVESVKNQTKIIHDSIPLFTDAHVSRQMLLKTLVDPARVAPYRDQLDQSRDGFHYDLQTAQNCVADLVKLI